MPLGQDYPAQDCSLARALEVVGERWTLLILRDCCYGVRRFADLQARLDIPKAMLTRRLDQLVEHELLERRPYGAGRAEYVITAKGRGLWPTVAALIAWGDEHYAPAGQRRSFRHEACGTDLVIASWCPHCARTVDVGELSTRPGPGAGNRRTDPVSVALREPHRMLTAPR